MIVSVEEWINDSEQGHFLLDLSKFKSSIPFEAAYLAEIQAALNTTSKEHSITIISNALEERFGNYQDSMRCWERLKAKPPCQVDDQITLYWG